MNSSRASTGSMRCSSTVRSAMIGMPYRVTFSVATALPCERDQRGSL